MALKIDPTQRFSSRVDNYVKYRPSYPQEIFDFLRHELGFKSSSVVADIGSGTGILTKLLLEKGNEVFAVEPNGPMREKAEEQFTKNPKYKNHFHSVAQRAEATGLKDHSVDFIFAAQAFHWFDPEKVRVEFSRIIKPGGQVVIIWNDRRIDRSEFGKAYEEMLLQYGSEYREMSLANVLEKKSLEKFFNNDDVQRKNFLNYQTLNFEFLQGRLLSTSYCPTPDDPNYQPILKELRRIFDAHAVSQNGQEKTVIMEYETRVYFGPLT